MPTGTVNINRYRPVVGAGRRSGSSSPSLAELGYISDDATDSLLDWKSDELSGKNNELDVVTKSSGQETVALSVRSGSVVTSEGVPAKADSAMKPRLKGYQSKAGTVALWPLSPRKLPKRRSCELSHRMSPCIEKATFHLYQLQDKISVEYSGNSASGNATNLGMIPHSTGALFGPMINYGKNPNRVQLKPLRRTSSELPPIEADVQNNNYGTQILGTGYIRPTDEESTLYELAQNVIDEHLLLLGRLETDRYNTEQSLIAERDRVTKLRKKIDDLAYKRLCDLPVAVQREHEACAYDIQELKWHVIQKQRAQFKAKEKLRQAELLNADLKEKIRRIEEHSPSVEAKLKADKEDMDKIDQFQKTADKDLADAVAQLAQMEEDYKKATTRADDEKEVLNTELSIRRGNLDRIMEVLQEAQAYHASYLKTFKDENRKLVEYSDELESLDKQLKLIVELENQKQNQVADLKTSIADQEREQKLLTADNTRLETERREQIHRLENENGKLELDIKKAMKELRELVNTNRTTEREIREIKKSTTKWGKQQTENEKAVQRAAQEMEKLQKELEIIESETTTLRQKNEKLNSRFNHLKENSEYQEETLKVTCENLGKQLKEESHARTILQAKITAESTDYQKVQDEAEKKKDKASKRADEIVTLVQTIRSQVEKLGKAHTDRRKVLAELVNITIKVKKQHEETDVKLTSNINDLRPQQEKKQEELSSLESVMNDMAWRTEAMNKKLIDMESSSEMMNKIIASTQDASTELSEELGELKIQLESSQKVQGDIKGSLGNYRERCDEICRKHEEHINKRDKFLNERERELENFLNINSRLAKRYYITQRLQLAIKHEFLRIYEKGLLSENNLHDQEGLCDLHRRLRRALQCYYELRGLQTRAGLAKFELLNQTNGARLGQIQDHMQSAIDHISQFLLANKNNQEMIKAQSEYAATSSTVHS